MTESLTTRQLAERLARNLLIATEHNRCIPLPGNDLGKDVNDGALSILATLRETGHWFCRVEQDADGVIDGEAEPWLLPEVRS